MDKENSKNNDNDEIIFEEITAGKSKSSKKDDIIFEEITTGKSNLSEPEDKNLIYEEVIAGRENFPNNRSPTQSNRIFPPMDNNTFNQQRILENFNFNIPLSNEDKRVLYPKIIDRLDNLWREGGNSIEYVERHAFEDSEIDNIMKTSWIIITEEKRQQIVKRIRLIFLAKYRFEFFYENLISVKESSPERFDKMIKDVLEIEAEFKLATGKALYQLHSEFEQDEKKPEQEQVSVIKKITEMEREEKRKGVCSIDFKTNFQFQNQDQVQEKIKLNLDNEKEQLNKYQDVDIKKDILVVNKDIDLIGDKEREEIKLRTEKFFDIGIPTKKDYILFYFGEEIKLLDDNEIIKLSEDYETKFETICVNMAIKLKELIITEYGGKILDMKEVPLSSIFSFDLGTKIRKVIKRENVALSEEILNRIKDEINVYRSNQKASINEYYEQSYKKIFDFIDEHIEFSRFIKQKKTGKQKITDPRYIDGTNEL